ncbi:MAG: single-stranded DNA-binding protein [Nitrospirae bacterium]|nr:single-stranded DNA-binding protein [Nitrospirota bacterium]
MYDINTVTVSGRINSVNFGETRKDVPACSFTIRTMAPKSSQPVLVRINLYGEYAKRCIGNLKRGVYVLVKGELMARRKSDGDIVFIDVRASDVIWCDSALCTLLNCDSDGMPHKEQE